MEGSAGEGLRRLGCPFCDYSTVVAARLGAHLERDHPGEVVLRAADRSAGRAGAGTESTHRDPSAWECLECGFVLVHEDRHAPAGIPSATRTADVADSARAGRPFACPRCSAAQAERPTGVDLFVEVRAD